MKLLVAEDESEIAIDVSHSLTEAGFAVTLCNNGEDAWFLGSTERFDVIVLDLGLPRLDGATVLRRWREEGMTSPVIVLTARSNWTERVEVINEGADDYLSKPFQMEELIARTRALLRRSKGQINPQIRIGQLALDTNKKIVTVNGGVAQLTPLEYRLISYLFHNKDRMVSREELKDHIYEQQDGRVDNAVEAMITRLRRKLGAEHIETRRGLGYCLKVSPG
jgi:two-component system, OmpR family, response regulator